MPVCLARDELGHGIIVSQCSVDDSSSEIEQILSLIINFKEM